MQFSPSPFEKREEIALSFSLVFLSQNAKFGLAQIHLVELLFTMFYQ